MALVQAEEKSHGDTNERNGLSEFLCHSKKLDDHEQENTSTTVNPETDVAETNHETKNKIRKVEPSKSKKRKKVKSVLLKRKKAKVTRFVWPFKRCDIVLNFDENDPVQEGWGQNEERHVYYDNLFLEDLIPEKKEKQSESLLRKILENAQLEKVNGSKLVEVESEPNDDVLIKQILDEVVAQVAESGLGEPLRPKLTEQRNETESELTDVVQQMFNERTNEPKKEDFAELNSMKPNFEETIANLEEVSNEHKLELESTENQKRLCSNSNNTEKNYTVIDQMMGSSLEKFNKEPLVAPDINESKLSLTDGSSLESSMEMNLSLDSFDPETAIEDLENIIFSNTSNSNAESSLETEKLFETEEESQQPLWILSDLPPPPEQDDDGLNELVVLSPPSPFRDCEEEEIQQPEMIATIKKEEDFDNLEFSNFNPLEQHQEPQQVISSHEMEIWKTSREEVMRSRELPLECAQCGKVFEMNWKLKEHEKSHNPQLKPYQCLKCKKRYASDYTIRNHIRRIHRGRAKFTLDGVVQVYTPSPTKKTRSGISKPVSIASNDEESFEEEVDSSKDTMVANEVMRSYRLFVG